MENENRSNVGEVGVKYTKEEVGGRLTDQELKELNSLVDEFESFADDEEDPKYQRWMDLNRRASGST